MRPTLVPPAVFWSLLNLVGLVVTLLRTGSTMEFLDALMFPGLLFISNVIGFVLLASLPLLSRKRYTGHAPSPPPGTLPARFNDTP